MLNQYRLAMSLIVNKSVNKHYDCGNINEVKRDLIEVFPHELVLEVFSHLNLASLGTICCVSKVWKLLANDSNLWKLVIYREIAIGSDKWAQWFGADVVKDEDKKEEFSSLPYEDFIKDCKKFKTIFTDRNAKESLMLVRLPKTLNGGLTLKSLGDLAKKYFPDSDKGYSHIWSAIVAEHGDRTIDKSHWVLMTKDVLPGSRNKTYNEQQKIVAELAAKSLSLLDYEVPGMLVAATCTFAIYFDSNIRLFSKKPNSYFKTYTSCKEEIQGMQTFAGNFNEDGLVVYHFHNKVSENLGVAAVRKF